MATKKKAEKVTVSLAPIDQAAAKANELIQPLLAEISDLEAFNAEQAFDYRDKKGNKLARSHVAKLRPIKTRINNAHKEAKGPILEAGRFLDSLKNDLLGRVDSMIQVHEEPLRQIEEEEQARVAEHIKVMDQVKAILDKVRDEWKTCDMADLTFAKDFLIGPVVADRDWEEFKAEAEALLNSAEAATDAAISLRTEWDQAQAELARLRAVEEEKRREEERRRIEEAAAARERARIQEEQTRKEEEAQRREARRVAMEQQATERKDREAREREERLVREKEEAEAKAKREAAAAIQRERDEADRRVREAEEQAQAEADQRVKEAEQRANRTRHVPTSVGGERPGSAQYRGTIPAEAMRKARASLIAQLEPNEITARTANKIIMLISDQQIEHVRLVAEEQP